MLALFLKKVYKWSGFATSSLETQRKLSMLFRNDPDGFEHTRRYAFEAIVALFVGLLYTEIKGSFWYGLLVGILIGCGPYVFLIIIDRTIGLCTSRFRRKP